MDQDKLDQIFRSTLLDHKTSLDKDQLWNAITKEQRRKGGYANILKILTALLVLGSLATFTWISNNNSDTKTSHLQFTSEKTLETKKGSENENDIENYNSLSESALVTEDLNANPIDYFNNELAEKPINKATSFTDEQQLETDKKNKAVRTKKLKTTTFANSNTKETLATQDKHTSTAVYNSSTSPYVSNSTAPLSASSENGYVSDKTSSKFDRKSEKKTKLPIALSSTDTKKTELAPAMVLSNTNIEIPISFLDHKRPLFQNKQSIECYDHRNKVSHFYAELYSSVDLVINNISAANPAALNYLAERKESQSQLEGYRAGLRLKYLLRNGLYLKTGIEVGITRERFNRSITEEKVEIRPNQLLETITQSDTTIYIYGNKAFNISETTTWKVGNSYRTVGIPVLLGFQKEVSKLTYGIEAGAIYNIQHRFEGMLLDDQSQPSMNIDYFKSSIHTSLTGGLSVGYKINSSNKIIAYSTFKHNLTDINNSLNPIIQSRTKYGLGVGLEIKL